MNLSGILVVVPPDAIETIVSQLDELPGVSVHHRDDPTGRIIVVQEAETVHAEVDGLRRIKALPGIIFAELVYHYLADDDSNVSLPPSDLDSMCGLPESVLEHLNN